MRLRAKIRKAWFRRFYATLAWVLRVLPRRKIEIQEYRTILIIRLGALGETLLTFPLTKELKQRYPEAHMAVLTLLRPVWQMNTYIDEILDFGHMSSLARAVARYRSYDLVLDTEPGGTLSAVYAHLFGKVAIGFDTIERRARLFDRPIPFNDRQYEAKTFLDLLRPLGIEATYYGLVPPVVKAAGRPAENGLLQRESIVRIGINLGGSYAAPERLWSIENFAALIKMLHEHFPCRFYFYGLKREKQLFDKLRGSLDQIDYIDLTYKLSIQDLVSRVREMDLFLSADTGTMHLAASLNIPVFSFFGPNLPLRFAPINRGSIAFYHPLPCSPCINVHLPVLPEARQCNAECTKSISVEEVYCALAKHIVNNRQGKKA